MLYARVPIKAVEGVGEAREGGAQDDGLGAPGDGALNALFFLMQCVHVAVQRMRDTRSGFTPLRKRLGLGGRLVQHWQDMCIDARARARHVVPLSLIHI